MGANKLNINPTCWAVSGIHLGQKYDSINVIPFLSKESILFTITTENGDLKKIAEVAFPNKKQTEKMYIQLTKQVISKQLQVQL